MSIRGVPLTDSLSKVDADAVRLHVTDNVVVAPKRIPKGARLARENVVAIESIPMGHKIATCPIKSGEIVRKYGQVIGAATADIAPGAHVHDHNLAMSDLRAPAERTSARWLRTEAPRHFMGYRRKDGRVGVRNYVGVLTSVNCSATVARHIAEAAERNGLLDGLDHIDGIVPITHTSGCGMAGSG
jgi:altronate dehydratase